MTQAGRLQTGTEHLTSLQTGTASLQTGTNAGDRDRWGPGIAGDRALETPGTNAGDRAFHKATAKDTDGDYRRGQST
jgi:hypothetical protein